MADIKAIKELALYAAKKQVPAAYAHKTVADVNEALRAELKELAGTFNLYRKNKYDLFEIMQETMDAIVPAEVSALIEQFEEVKTYANGSKPQFKIKKGAMRARKFATKATASGVYETFRLDTDVVDVETFVIGDAAYIDFERFLSGDEDWADYMAALMDGILHCIYKSIFTALTTGAGILTAVNQAAVNTYSADALAALITIVKNYGAPVIVATTGFVDAMGPDVIYPTYIADGKTVNNLPVADDIASIHNTGKVKIFRGCPIVEIPNNYEDETNTVKTFEKDFAIILPSTGEKVVKVAFEGETIVKDWENRDNSMEIQAYKKMGVAIISGNNWARYILG